MMNLLRKLYGKRPKQMGDYGMNPEHYELDDGHMDEAVGEINTDD